MLPLTEWQLMQEPLFGRFAIAALSTSLERLCAGETGDGE